MSVCLAYARQITQPPKNDDFNPRVDPELNPGFLLPLATMVAVDLPDFTVCVSVFPFAGTAAYAVPAVMNAPTANKAMVFIVPPLLVSPADAENMMRSCGRGRTIQRLENAKFHLKDIRHLPYFEVARQKRYAF